MLSWVVTIKLAVGHTDLGQVSHVVVYTGMDERTNKLIFNFFCMLADKSTKNPDKCAW